MTTRVWITRTAPASKSETAWRDADFAPVMASLLSIVPVETEMRLPAKADLVFTSAHGVRHGPPADPARRVYAVGAATAEVARSKGFADIVTGEGDWRDLLSRIELSGPPIVHVGGEVTRGRLVEELRERGREASRLVVYRSDPAKDWPDGVNGIGAVALYSPMASETLISLPPRDLSGVTALCLSEAVAEPLRKFRSDMTVHIADAPNELSLIACSRRAGL